MPVAMEKKVLKISLDDIPPEGLEVPIEDREGLVIKDCFPIKTPIIGRVFLQRWGPIVKIRGHIETTLVLICDRCTENFYWPISENIDIELHPIASLKAVQEEVRLSKEDLDVSFFDGDLIEVDEVVREQILLAVPMRKLCRQDCKGLCPVCGQNLNKETCACKPLKQESPFAILKKLVVSPNK